MTGRINSRIERLETKLGVNGPNMSALDGVDLSKLTDDELLDRIYWLVPDRAERWPGWAHMSPNERSAAVTDADLRELASNGFQEMGTDL